MVRLKRRLRKLLGIDYPPHSQQSYSQEGEDRVLVRYFGDVSKMVGRYVDVGAHHPSRFSNTRLFYEHGWRGINIDPRPGFAVEFLQARPCDIAIETAIANQEGELTYYMFDEPALNGFDADLANERDQSTDYKIIDRKKVIVRRLADVLSEQIRPHDRIDFMSIDVEGLDHDVLKSNNWEQFRPRFVLVEIYGATLDAVVDSPSATFMENVGYKLCSRTSATAFFEDQQCRQHTKAA